MAKTRHARGPGRFGASATGSARLASLAAIAYALIAFATFAQASGPTITGGGSTTGMTRFALAVSNGNGHFECLMPKLMTVEATVTSATLTSPTSATFKGMASVTLAEANPFHLPPGPLARNVPFTATAIAGGPGVGFEELDILGQRFPGTIEDGQISIR